MLTAAMTGSEGIWVLAAAAAAFLAFGGYMRGSTRDDVFLWATAIALICVVLAAVPSS